MTAGIGYDMSCRENKYIDDKYYFYAWSFCSEVVFPARYSSYVPSVLFRMLLAKRLNRIMTMPAMRQYESVLLTKFLPS